MSAWIFGAVSGSDSAAGSFPADWLPMALGLIRTIHVSPKRCLRSNSVMMHVSNTLSALVLGAVVVVAMTVALPAADVVTADVRPAAVIVSLDHAAGPGLGSDVGCADASQVQQDGKMHSACTVIYDSSSPAQRKDARDCVVAGAIGAAGGSPGGPAGAAAGGAAGCAGAVYANHSD